MNIYVGSIPFKIKEIELKEMFEQYGEVASVRIVMDKITRQNKGFAFIEMPSDEEGQYAIKQLHGSELMGRQIEVSVSVQRDDHAKKAFNSAPPQRSFHRADTQKRRPKR